MPKCKCGSEGEWINDGHGIPLVVVCEKNACRKEALKGFRSDIMDNYEADEPIEPEDTHGWD